MQRSSCVGSCTAPYRLSRLHAQDESEGMGVSVYHTGLLIREALDEDELERTLPKPARSS